MAQQKKPNILLIMADDVGWFDVGAYHRGIMGTPTPNIDRIARDGVLLTDCYAQASCTAGCAAFITGQIPMRTGLTTVGRPPKGKRPGEGQLIGRRIELVSNSVQSFSSMAEFHRPTLSRVTLKVFHLLQASPQVSYVNSSRRAKSSAKSQLRPAT
jgi:hypothetical protein